jgi:hypothetical protein
MNASISVHPRRLELLDTSVLLEILEVPHESDHSVDVLEEFQAKCDAGVKLQIPMATVLETGAHIRKIKVPKKPEVRKNCAKKFARFLDAALSHEAPWKFTSFSWNDEVIRSLLDGKDHGYGLERSIGDGVFEIGDLTIVEEWRLSWRNVSPKVYDVDVWTRDAVLRGVIDDLRGC